MGIGLLRPPLAVILAARDEQLKREREVDAAVREGLRRFEPEDARYQRSAAECALRKREVQIGLKYHMLSAWREQHA